jgi:acyl carrier protein
MTISPTLSAIINEVRGNKGQPPLADLRSEMRLREDIGFSSLDLAELTVRIEEACGVDVFADGLVTTVGEIAEKLDARSR